MHPPLLHGPGGLLSLIAPRKTFARNRRQAKKETRVWEKEERRRKTEVEDKKKKKATEYFRTLLAHREEFFRFHKNKRIGKKERDQRQLSISFLFFLHVVVFLSISLSPISSVLIFSASLFRFFFFLTPPTLHHIFSFSFSSSSQNL